MTDCRSRTEAIRAESGAAARRPASITGFGQDEARAFWRGMRDGPHSLRGGLLASWLEDLFRIAPRPPIADPRLESIRRLTVALRHGLRREGAIELERARDEGVSERQIAAILFRLRAAGTATRGGRAA
ncbi:MAG: hypothetical protein JOZ90_00625 [Alphaproteobacteria bacterium]|nr:hypothetical protein [Alphaproteobacteria bacterium]MBV9372289.1 hypothetical protein [Alphaproteobacteria bacterium]MBV9899581.1 hypothetical protein [Alphaproteobacteria bacterium]